MKNTSYLFEVLDRKIPDSSEIELHLFELCNLRCHFCGQDHDDKTGFDQILNKIPRIIEFIQNNPRKSHILNIMGGEIFSDEVPNYIIDHYSELAISIDKFAKSIGHNCTFNWVTNLIFKNDERILKFTQSLSDHGVDWNISTSYDFTGRKNSLWSLDLFEKNIELFKEKIFTVGFVLTKTSIKHLLSKEDKYFDYLYSKYPLYFDFYVPENGANLLMPSDRDILDTYLYIAKNYPLISPVKELLENEQNKMTCYSLNKLTLLPDGKEVKCRYLNYKEGQFNTPVDYQSNENIIEAHLEENECFSCEWYDRCGFRCFVQADWAKRERLPSCLFKTFFKEISAWS